MAGDTGDINLAVLAQLPVGDDAGRDLAVTVHALRRGVGRLSTENGGGEGKKGE
jgi:hypothetical protein